MEIIYKDIDERFDNPIFRKYALSVVKEKEIVLKDRFKNLQKVNLILEISMIGDHKTLQSENKYLWTENETVLNLRVIPDSADLQPDSADLQSVPIKSIKYKHATVKIAQI
jgi:hypothetical protein